MYKKGMVDDVSYASYGSYVGLKNLPFSDILPVRNPG